MNFTKVQIIFVVLVIIAIVFLFFYQSGEIKQVEIGGKMFFVEVARTNMELERGLSLHIPLSADQGMLFVFPEENYYGIWMKDMLFPIDILWIDSDLKLVHLEKNISPETYPKIFQPKTKSLYVLEISAGQAEFLNIKIGDGLKFVKK